MWEDEKCKDGGRWILKVPKAYSNKFWEDLLLAMIGEQFRTEDEILGLVISLRPHQDTISLWHKSGKDQKIIDTIREDIESIVKLEEGMKIDYENFAESIANMEKNKEQKKEYEGDDQKWQMREKGGKGHE